MGSSPKLTHEDFVMKLSLIGLCLLPMALAGVERVLPQSMTAPIVAKSAPESDSEHTNYIQSQAPDLALWRRKVADFSARAETKVDGASQAAKLETEAAWSALETSSVALTAAGARDWRSAKSAYDGAKSNLEAKWAKFDTGKT